MTLLLRQVTSTPAPHLSLPSHPPPPSPGMDGPLSLPGLVSPGGSKSYDYLLKVSASTDLLVTTWPPAPRCYWWVTVTWASRRSWRGSRTGLWTRPMLLLLGQVTDGGVFAIKLEKPSSFHNTSSFIKLVIAAYKTTIILIDGKRVKLQLWDTSGQGRFCTIIR